MAPAGMAFRFFDPSDHHSSHRDLFYPEKSFLDCWERNGGSFLEHICYNWLFICSMVIRLI